MAPGSLTPVSPPAGSTATTNNEPPFTSIRKLLLSSGSEEEEVNVMIKEDFYQFVAAKLDTCLQKIGSIGLYNSSTNQEEQ